MSDKMSQERRITLDPSKFKLGPNGEVVLMDPEVTKVIQEAHAHQAQESNKEDEGPGIGIGLIVVF